MFNSCAILYLCFALDGGFLGFHRVIPDFIIRYRINEYAHFNLSAAVELHHEEKAGKESNGSGKDEEEKGDHEGISKVEEGVDKAGELELRHVVVDAVEENVHGAEAARQERSPPPVVILRIELNVAKNHRQFRAGYRKNYEND
jgi:hypothetical protein